MMIFLEEDVRFELTGPFGPSVFKTDAIDHSANLPLLNKYLMTKQDLIDVINRLIAEKYDDTHLQILYERGVLTAIIVQLMYDDSHVAHKVINILKKNKEKS